MAGHNFKALQTHEERRKPPYANWYGMKTRCYNKNHIRYSRYGGRGISVCEEWHSYDNFKKWALENGFKEGLVLDRIDNNGNYEPSNCRWTTYFTNARNSIKLMKKNKTGFRGVHKKRSRNKYVAQISVKKKVKHIGIYETPIEAALAYDTYVIVYGLEHTRNFA